MSWWGKRKSRETKNQQSAPKRSFFQRRVNGAQSVASSVGRSAGQAARRAGGVARQEFGRIRNKQVKSWGYGTTTQNFRTETLQDITSIRKDLNTLRLNLRNTLNVRGDANKVQRTVQQIRTKLNTLNKRYKSSVNIPATPQSVVVQQPNSSLALGKRNDPMQSSTNKVNNYLAKPTPNSNKLNTDRVIKSYKDVNRIIDNAHKKGPPVDLPANLTNVKDVETVIRYLIYKRGINKAVLKTFASDYFYRNPKLFESKEHMRVRLLRQYA